MIKKEKYYQIADICIKAEYDFTYEMPDGNAIDFVTEPFRPDFIFTFHKVDNIQKFLTGAVILEQNLMYYLLQNQEGRKIAAFEMVDYSHCFDVITIYNEESKSAEIIYLDEQLLLDRYVKGFNFLNYCCLELMFPLFDALVLHSSHIDLGGRAILFSAPSQTGKSTQANLWKEAGLARVINGDRTVIRKIDDIWYACGCPMCGTSGIHVNSREPLSNIVMLEQGKDNVVTRLTGLKAYMEVYTQITMPTKFPELAERNMDNLDIMLQEVPVWLYSCTKDPEAVYVLRDTLFHDI